jgi:hypothetical protein
VAKNTTHRLRLLATDPHCHWCGREVREYNVGEAIQPPDQATLDHLHPKGHPNRRPIETRADATVLSCFECNQRRNHQMQPLLKPRKQRIAQENL